MMFKFDNIYILIWPPATALKLYITYISEKIMLIKMLFIFGH